MCGRLDLTLHLQAAGKKGSFVSVNMCLIIKQKTVIVHFLNIKNIYNKQTSEIFIFLHILYKKKTKKYFFNQF